MIDPLHLPYSHKSKMVIQFLAPVPPQKYDYEDVSMEDPEHDPEHDSEHGGAHLVTPGETITSDTQYMR